MRGRPCGRADGDSLDRCAACFSAFTAAQSAAPRAVATAAAFHVRSPASQPASLAPANAACLRADEGPQHDLEESDEARLLAMNSQRPARRSHSRADAAPSDRTEMIFRAYHGGMPTEVRVCAALVPGRTRHGVCRDVGVRACAGDDWARYFLRGYHRHPAAVGLLKAVGALDSQVIASPRRPRAPASHVAAQNIRLLVRRSIRLLCRSHPALRRALPAHAALPPPRVAGGPSVCFRLVSSDGPVVRARMRR